MTTFYSIDVETTGTNPHDKSHQLATVGAIAVSEQGLLGGSWYQRLRYRDSWDAGTREWWRQQNRAAQDEMFSAEHRLTPKFAARLFVDWVNETRNGGEATFVANPATFDHSWVLRWLTEAKVEMPFSYRTLCLRGADWGRNPGPWGLGRNGHTSIVPHHALYDAQAQALDLLDLLRPPT